MMKCAIDATSVLINDAERVVDYSTTDDVSRGKHCERPLVQLRGFGKMLSKVCRRPLCCSSIKKALQSHPS